MFGDGLRVGCCYGLVRVLNSAGWCWLWCWCCVWCAVMVCDWFGVLNFAGAGLALCCALVGFCSGVGCGLLGVLVLLMVLGGVVFVSLLTTIQHGLLAQNRCYNNKCYNIDSCGGAYFCYCFQNGNKKKACYIAGFIFIFYGV